MFKDDDFEKHPGFGLVGFSRVSGNPGKLFGSNLESHGTYISLSIHQAKRSHDLGQDFVMADRSELGVIEVHLSAAQFAELLTSMNIGDGVPCTIHRRDGRTVEEIPTGEQSEPERIQDAFEAKVAGIVEKLKGGVKEGRESLLAKGPILRKEREHIAKVLEWLLREVESNMPFHLRQFQESTERTTTQAKAEVDAFVTTAAINLGIEQLAQAVKSNSPPAFLTSRVADTRGDSPPAFLTPRMADGAPPAEGEKWTCAECGEWFVVAEVPVTVCPYCNSRDIDLWETTQVES